MHVSVVVCGFPMCSKFHIASHVKPDFVCVVYVRFGHNVYVFVCVTVLCGCSYGVILCVVAKCAPCLQSCV